ncbi:MAG TPA: ABC transporter permease [Gaiellaceae bacterium]|nr:ABC transporter permease [Gaiellaceae bacterium]
MTPRAFLHRPQALVGAVLLVALVAACLLVPVLSPHDPYAVDFAQKLQGPTADHPLGTDFFGRDLLVRMALGGRASLLVAAAALALILVLGFVYGSVAALARPRLGALLLRVLDAVIALPRLPILIVILVAVRLQANVLTLVFALAVVNWMLTARLVHGQIVSLQEREFVVAARAVGARSSWIAVRHLLPNSLGILLVAAFLELPALILSEALVSVLGLGLNPPQASWGTIAQDAIGQGRTYELVLPSVGIALFAIAANWVADGLQDVLDPRSL